MRMPGVPKTARPALQRVRLQLADVTPPRTGMPLPAWRPSRLNTRYQPALRLAELILAGDSFEQRVGDLKVSGFVLDMWRIYEDFVCVALSEALRERGGSSSLQHGMHLDLARHVPIRPDFVWSQGGRARVVADAKYKAEKPSGFPQADLYQMLAYCTVLGLDEGHLVYAKGTEEPAVHVVRGSGVRIVCHTLDLADPPSALLRQIGELGAQMLPERAGASAGLGADHRPTGTLHAAR